MPSLRRSTRSVVGRKSRRRRQWLRNWFGVALLGAGHAFAKAREVVCERRLGVRSACGLAAPAAEIAAGVVPQGGGAWVRIRLRGNSVGGVRVRLSGKACVVPKTASRAESPRRRYRRWLCNYGGRRTASRKMQVSRAKRFWRGQLDEA